jgi:hypothetical protein
MRRSRTYHRAGDDEASALERPSAYTFDRVRRHGGITLQAPRIASGARARHLRAYGAALLGLPAHVDA